jgi:uncharacterized protein
MPRPFLTAQWRNLVLANYPVDESSLRSMLPSTLEPDRFNGRCWVSLVGFQFRRTRVFGVGWPGHRDFPEWNLRAYVRQGDRRGVIFIREFVPRRLVALIARVVYNEPYRTTPISDRIEDRIGYRVRAGGRWHELSVRPTDRSKEPVPGSETEFFTDQKWGYGLSRRGVLQRYSVVHSIWPIETVEDVRIDVDWDGLYGAEWASLNGQTPASVLYTVGSDVAVYAAERSEAKNVDVES